MSQTGRQIIAIQTLLNISRVKGNQRMKFSHLIEYNMRSLFKNKTYF